MADGEDLVSVDGVDVYDLGLRLVAIPGVWSTPPIGYAATSIPRRAGGILNDATPDVGMKGLMLLARGQFADAATAETSLATLKDALMDRLCRITFNHASTRSYYGVLESMEIGHIDSLALPGWVSLPVGFLCPDPYAIDDALTVVSGIAAERVAIQVGSGPTFPTITVTGAATTPTLTLRDHSGTSIATMIAANIAAGDCWRVSTLEGLSEKCVSGTWSSNLDALTAGYAFPVILPRYANRALSSWPTIETSSGTLSVSYARRWA